MPHVQLSSERSQQTSAQSNPSPISFGTTGALSAAAGVPEADAALADGLIQTVNTQTGRGYERAFSFIFDVLSLL